VNFELSGKTGIVTGGARGIGAETAALLARSGATVVVADVLDELGAQVVSELTTPGLFVHHDVTSEADWEAVVTAAVELNGSLDFVVNNAGLSAIGLLIETELEHYERVVKVNQVGTFLGMRAAARQMISQKSGSIVNLSSVHGMTGFSGYSAYGATKWAIRGMTRIAALELGQHGIRVNAVLPGPTETGMTASDLSQEDSDALWRRLIPVGRIGQPLEIANAIAFLVSDASSFSSGADFLIDGGRSAGYSSPVSQSIVS